MGRPSENGAQIAATKEVRSKGPDGWRPQHGGGGQLLRSRCFVSSEGGGRRLQPPFCHPPALPPVRRRHGVAKKRPWCIEKTRAWRCRKAESGQPDRGAPRPLRRSSEEASGKLRRN